MEHDMMVVRQNKEPVTSLLSSQICLYCYYYSYYFDYLTEP